jgi:hypothetical protein
VNNKVVLHLSYAHPLKAWENHGTLVKSIYLDRMTRKEGILCPELTQKKPHTSTKPVDIKRFQQENI